MLLTTCRLLHLTAIFFIFSILIIFGFGLINHCLNCLFFFAISNLVLLIKVLPMKKACILFSEMYIFGHVSITSHGRKCIGFDQCEMFRDAGDLVLMERSCLCCLIICLNNFQNSFGRLFYRYIHMHVIGSTIFFFYILDTLKRVHFDICCKKYHF